MNIHVYFLFQTALCLVHFFVSLLFIFGRNLKTEQRAKKKREREHMYVCVCEWKTIGKNVFKTKESAKQFMRLAGICECECECDSL